MYSVELYMVQANFGFPGGPRTSFAHGHSGGSSAVVPCPQKPPYLGAYFHGSLANSSLFCWFLK